MYCIKCRIMTNTADAPNFIIKNRRPMIRGRCVMCGEMKIQLSCSGQNFQAKCTFFQQNFTGPGTHLDQRLNPDLTLKEWSKPINCVDRAAYRHDLAYAKHQDTAY